jgi:hypothetical protein
MHHDPRVRQGEPLAGGARGQQELTHRTGHAHGDRGHVVLDGAHGVVDREPGVVDARAAGRSGDPIDRLGWDEPGIGTAGGLAAAAALVGVAAVMASFAVRVVRWDPRP